MRRVPFSWCCAFQNLSFVSFLLLALPFICIFSTRKVLHCQLWLNIRETKRSLLNIQLWSLGTKWMNGSMNKLNDDFQLIHSLVNHSKAAHLKIIKWDKIILSDCLQRWQMPCKQELCLHLSNPPFEKHLLSAIMPSFAFMKTNTGVPSFPVRTSSPEQSDI